MTFSYTARLIILCLASFFIVQTLLSLAVSSFAAVLIRRAERTRPAVAVRVLLVARLLPSLTALLFVVCMCVPSYLVLEHHRLEGEQVGWLCAVTAVAGIFIWAVSFYRGAKASFLSARFTRWLRRTPERCCLAGDSHTVWIVEEPRPLFALAGVVHPRLVVARCVMQALSPDQLEVAMRHEQGHRRSYDNLTRLVLLLAPATLPLAGFRSLEKAWARFTEWAADDFAVNCDPLRSLSLADALVRVARMGSAPVPSPLVTSLVPTTQDLSERVERLLRTPTPARKRLSGWRATSALVLGAVASTSLALLLMQPATLHLTHEVLEHLMH